MKAYYVAHWDETHETAESRKYVKLSWFAQPNKHDGFCFRWMTLQKNRCELLAGWELILQVSSKGRRGERGWLVRNGRALDAAGLAMLTGFEKGTFEQAIKFFSTEPMNWLVQREFPAVPGKSPGAPEESPGLPLIDQSTVQDRREGTKKKDANASKIQFAAIKSRIEELTKLGEARDEEEENELADLKKRLKKVRDSQITGQFA